MIDTYEMESHFIGVVLKLQPEDQEAIFNTVKNEFFLDPVIGKHFVAMRKSFREVGYVDIVNFPDKVRGESWFLGLEFLLDSMTMVSSVSNWPYYATELERNYTKVCLQKIGKEFVEMSSQSSPEQSLHFIRESVEKLSVVSQVKNIDEVIEEDLLKPPPERAFLTGIGQLDKSAKFAYQHLDIIAARPSTGKTTLLVNMLANIPNHKKVLFFSMEQPRHEILDILAAVKCKVMIEEVTYQRPRFWREMQKEGELSHILIDDHTNSLSKIEMEIVKVRPDIVFLDNLQGFDLSGQGKQNRTYALQDICRGLKFMAKQYNCCIILVVQLGRESQVEDKEPEMYHIKDSGGVEQEADLIVGMYEKKHTQETWFKILKYRQGQKDISFEVDYMKPFGVFR